MGYLDKETEANHHSSGGGTTSEAQEQQKVVIRMPSSGMTMVERHGIIMPDGREEFLKRLRAINVLRARNDFKTYENAGLLYFTTAIAGEIGELGEIIEKLAVFAMLSAKSGSLCNLVKKLERAKVGGPDHGNTTKLADITPEKLRDEIGGIQIYLDLMASLLDIGIEEATIETFNNVSVKIGSKYRL